ncbi:aspartate aminotransferase family protein [Rhodobacteraceae bacterium 2376]|uniref:Acetylornithine aminotransferase n=1 Tax=Rhabdonatronobacter sediminivivens TaxID=2743469 RepID=A0A7Z0I1S2_9RHOB|nr:aspartate aminotransferase family protein [Rhabdonatronobacter sediminivivens]NYS26328.1 aspartate aminotransferase family protein [Rhabdonatronobacter sediminivivens]
MNDASFPSILPTYARAPLSFERGEGAWLIERDGRRFLDMTSGIGVNALGHAHPALVDALSEQAAKLWHTSNLFNIPAQEALAAALVEHTFADTAFFTNSGTEALELAVKMVRKFWHDAGAPQRQTILAFEGAFHGRSMAAISAAGSAKLTTGFGPLLPGFRQLPFGDHDALTAALDDTIAAVIVEPIQGEGGIRVLPDVCLKGLREACDRTGALLIFDEVQCGMGRTGRLFAHEWAGVTPDIMMVAKGIGGGFPLGATLATAHAAAPMTAGTHGSTYGGNPLACAVGARVMEIVSAPAFLAEVARKGSTLWQHLEGLAATHPQVIEEVRGEGLMAGLKCVVPNTDLVAAARDQNLLAVPAADNVIRLLPPLTITEEELSEAIYRLDRAASTLSPA